jgi:hypothetical protein
MSSKIIIQHSDNNGSEYGYGLYINAVGVGIAGEIWASECLNENATEKQIKMAEHRVRARGLRAMNKIMLGQ